MQTTVRNMAWLHEPWQAIRDRLNDNRLPHALLVTGEQGVGKRDFAEAVAALLVCDRVLAAPVPEEPCGECKQCALTLAGTHPDIRFYAPEKSRMIRVDQVRALSAFAVGSPQVAHRKVIVVDRADQLNINAANALLKTLEEPSADVVLILLQEAGRPILPTLRSRCQGMVLRTPDHEAAARWLAEQIALLAEEDRPDAASCITALELAGGAPRLALEYVTGDFLQQRRDALDSFRRFMKSEITLGEAARPFKTIGLEETLWLLESWAADLARLAAGGAGRDAEAEDMLRYLAQNNPPWKAHQLLDAIHEARAAGVYNVNPELEAERLLMQWQALMPVRRTAAR